MRRFGGTSLLLISVVLMLFEDLVCFVFCSLDLRGRWCISTLLYVYISYI